MSYSVSLEEGTPQQYEMKVMSELLAQAHILGLDVEEFVGFFASQVQAMLASPPNYNKLGVKAKVWILRGFYPETSIFFKLILVTKEQNGYYAKVTPLRILFRAKGGRSWDDYECFEGRDL